MATISSAGIGSGLDINGIITKLMAVEQQPLTALDKKEASFQAKLSAFGLLKSAVSSLEAKTFSLSQATLYSGKTASSSDTTIVTASTNTAATAGSYSLQVVDIAQAHTIASQTFNSLTSNLSATSGKLKIELGSFSSGSYTPDPARTAVTIDIAASDSSLSSIRDAINNANSGVKASIVTIGVNQYKLTLTSTATGAANSIRLTALDGTNTPITKDNTNLAQLSFDPTATSNNGKEFEVTAVAQNSHLKIDGVDLYRSTNTVSDAITGVTLTTLKNGNSVIKVAANVGAATDAMAGFVSAYNDLNTQLRSQTAFDQATKQAALLFGDDTARGLRSTLTQMLAQVFSGGGAIQRLSDLGVSLQRDGSLKFDSSKMATALTNTPTVVSTAMASTNANSPGLAVTFEAQLKALISDSGLFAGKSDSIQRSVTDIGKQRDKLNLRLTSIEARYRKQFTALDSLVASMQQTQSYLTQQLAALTSSTK